jgi:hypothetical protein
MDAHVGARVCDDACFAPYIKFPKSYEEITSRRRRLAQHKNYRNKYNLDK